MLFQEEQDEMKIYVLSNSSLIKDLVTGGDIVLPQTAKCWRNKYEIHLVCGVIGKGIWQDFGPKVKTHVLKENFLEKTEWLPLGPLKYVVRAFQTTVIIDKVLKKEEGKIVIITPSDYFVDVIPAFWARMRFKNARWLARAYHIIESPLKRKGNFLANTFSFLAQRIGLFLIKGKADLVVPLGGTYKDLVAMNFDKNKLKISNAGVDMKALRRTKPIRKKFEAIEIGMLTVTRGVYDLLDIWKLVVEKMPKAKLAIVGGGAGEVVREYKEKIFTMGLKKNIHYFGYLPKNEEVYAVLKASKIHLCPLHENGWSLPVAEAMSVGIPTVAYERKMFGTAFKKGYITAPTHDKKRFAQVVVELLKDETKLRKLSQDALEESKYFDWQYIAGDLLNEIEKLGK